MVSLLVFQNAEFDRACELNMALDLGGLARFRVNIFKQRQHSGLVIRQITTKIPSLEQLGLPQILGDVVMAKRGMVIMVGATGSGKSTTLAAMIDHRNASAPGHIITIEDPIEFIHDHKQCLVTQREVGIDTGSFDNAIKNALRQKPDVILLGEIRDADTMQHAINISETGHLCLATLHANNANQALERILGFFERDARQSLLMNLSMNLNAILSQRLVPTIAGKRTAALEVMLNQGLIKDLIKKGEVKEIKGVMAQNQEQCMQTFDQCLSRLCLDGVIEEEVALAEADNASDMKLALQRAKLGAAGGEGLKGVDTSALSM